MSGARVVRVEPPSFIYGTAWKEERTAGLVEKALRTGFRAIDTANQRRHYFEAGVGEGLAASYRTGIVKRDDLFLQTKFTYRPGQDHRLPYDPSAPFREQVRQSLASSLEHLGTDYVDSFVLHGPASSYEWTTIDSETWAAMRAERDACRAKLLGVSNVSLRHLQHMKAEGLELPVFVQNRCFARTGWDRAVREFCRENRIAYQGFSLLTANQEVVFHPLIAKIAASVDGTPAQVIFSFARGIGMIPMTGTSDEEHMKQDLQAVEVKLPNEALEAIEGLAA